MSHSSKGKGDVNEPEGFKIHPLHTVLTEIFKVHLNILFS